MSVRLILAGITACALSTPALAEAAPADFCASAPAEMLAALDGTWTLKQGAGAATAASPTGIAASPIGGMTIPLPPHKPQRFTLKFDPALGHSELSGEGQKMAMISADAKALDKVSRHLDSDDVSRMVAKGQGCEWYSLPIMVGSKMYKLQAHDPGSKEADWWMYLPFPGKPMLVCLRNDGIAAIDFGGPERVCETPPHLLDGKGDMKMSLVMKFQSARSGSGVLVFEGKSGKSRFAAIAPITMSR